MSSKENPWESGVEGLPLHPKLGVEVQAADKCKKLPCLGRHGAHRTPRHRTPLLHAITAERYPPISLPGVKGLWNPFGRKICIILINNAIFKNFPGSCRFIGRVKLNTTTKTGYQEISLALMFIDGLTSQHLIPFWWERGADNLRPRKMALWLVKL